MKLSPYEPFETYVLSQVIKSGHIVLNIGAHRGHYTLTFAKLVGETGKVFAFEPEPNNFAALKRTVDTQGFKNITLEQKAVSNTTAPVKLYLSAKNPGDHRIYDSGDCRPFIEVQAIRLDDYFRNYTGKIDFIKMDIQGAEMTALQGMTWLLQRNKGLSIATEFWPFGLKTSGTEPIDYLNALIKLGFKLSNINEQRRKLEPILDLQTFIANYSPGSQHYTNLLAASPSLIDLASP